MKTITQHTKVQIFWQFIFLTLLCLSFQFTVSAQEGGIEIIPDEELEAGVYNNLYCTIGSTCQDFQHDYSGARFSSNEWKAFDNFTACTSPVTSFCVEAIYYNSASDCSAGQSHQFEISYYQDAGNIPGALLAGPYTVTATIIDAGTIFFGADLKVFSFEHAPVSFTAGSNVWVSIFATNTGSPDCYFTWGHSNGNDNLSYQEFNSDGIYLSRDYDLNMVVGQSNIDEFITTWETTAPGETITIPTPPTGIYDYTVDWGDGNVTPGYTGDATHAYATPGVYTVKVSGDFPRIFFNNAGDKDKILTVEQWGTQEWQSMANAFKGCTNLTVPATDAPDLSAAIFANSMFEGCSALNCDVSHWDVTNIEFMNSMFKDCALYNQGFCGWNTANVSKMNSMFENCSSFDQDLGCLDISGLTNADMMLDFTAVSEFNYDNTLLGWGAQAVQSLVPFGVQGLTYCLGKPGRDNLLANTWYINGDGFSCEAFITTWDVDAGETITLPYRSAASGKMFDIDWGDGTITTGHTTQNPPVHTYAAAGLYQIRATGDMSNVYFNDGGDKLNILEINSWGPMEWTTMTRAFWGCENLEVHAVDIPDLSGVISTSHMFRECSSLDQDINDWDVSNVVDMRFMFAYADNFNQDLNLWDVSNARFMISTFRDAESFNGDISTWDVSSMEYANFMFMNAENFDGDIGGWDTGDLNKANGMFRYASDFDQDLGGWDIANLTNAHQMLDDTDISEDNYDSLLLGWSDQSFNDNVSLGADGLYYCAGKPGREILVDAGWSISGDTDNCAPTRVFNKEDGAIGIDRNLGEDTEPQELSVYPNPVSEMINIDIPVKEGNFTLTIFDNMGKKIWTNNYVDQSQLQLNLSELGLRTTGTYQLLLTAPYRTYKTRMVYIN